MPDKVVLTRSRVHDLMTGGALWFLSEPKSHLELRHAACHDLLAWHGRGLYVLIAGRQASHGHCLHMLKSFQTT